MAVLLTYWHPQRLILLVLVPSAEAPRPPRHRAGRKYRRRLERLERRICAEVCAELLAQPNVPVSQEPGRRPAGEPKLHRRSSPPARHLPGPVPLSTPPPPPLQPHQGPSRTPWQLVPLDIEQPEYDPERPSLRSNPDDPRGRPAPAAIPWFNDEDESTTYHRRPLTPRPPEPRIIPLQPSVPEI